MEKWKRMKRQRCMSKTRYILNYDILENMPAVLSLGELFDENGYSYEWINGQKTTSHFKRDSDNLQYGQLRSYCGSRLVKFVFCIWLINFEDTFKTSESLLKIFFQLVFVTNSRWNQDSRTGGSNWEWHLSRASAKFGSWAIRATRYWPSK